MTLPKMAELSYILQFMRVLSIQCKHVGLKWQLIGACVRAIVCQRKEVPSLDIVLTHKRKPSFQAIRSLVYELEVMGYISKADAGATTTPLNATVTMAVGTTTKSFDVVFHCGPIYHDGVLESASMLQFSCDFLCIDDNGIGVIERDPINDHYNPCAGLSVLERYAELQQNSTKMTGKYVFKMPLGVIRTHNAMLLRRQAELEISGIRVIGGVKMHGPQGDDGCPVCMDNHQAQYVTLECGHTFCVECLAKHMEEKTSPDTRHLCMICRRAIVAPTQ